MAMSRLYSLFGSRRCKRCSLVLLSLAGTLLWLAAPARSETWEVSIRQSGGVSKGYSRPCDDAGPACGIRMPITLENGEKENLQARILFQPGGLVFRFELDGMPLAASGLGDDGFYMPVGESGEQSRKITLYTPNPLAESDSVDSLYRRPVQRISTGKVATLQVTVVRKK